MMMMKDVTFSTASVCLSVNGITKKTTDQIIFMKFYGIVGHRPNPEQSD